MSIRVSNIELQSATEEGVVFCEEELATGRAYSDISDIYPISKRRSGKKSSLTALASSESIFHLLANILAKKFLEALSKCFCGC